MTRSVAVQTLEAFNGGVPLVDVLIVEQVGVRLCDEEPAALPCVNERRVYLGRPHGVGHHCLNLQEESVTVAHIFHGRKIYLDGTTG